MSGLWRRVALCLSLSVAVNAHAAEGAKTLRVCADPNNLPFSNERGEGFENRLAEIVARELGRKLEYTWWAQRRGFFRNTLNAGRCDLVMGVPSGFEMALTTQPYYRSSYALVYRENAGYAPRSLDDPQLRTLRIGLHFIGDDYSNPPPAEALARRGIVRNVVGYSLYGDYRESNPPARLIEAVARREVDVAIAWGPLAGYFAKRQPVELVVVPLPTPREARAQPFEFSIAIGVRKGNEPLQAALDKVLVRKRNEVAGLLEEYGVPLVDTAVAYGQ
ncbi:substrate-binding domain-containing protein [Methylocaldum sp.]|uniref:substrate-binding domain-containing protein n=1 Tax=Methylocaldum sp. TaxID=1969727 RepID=UPI002D736833|nr:substrate-binding domain-containing protein [Methylocaldum sp.]HYE33814.1 substrate-binding domain-containing protein [Methylocaldum sp.]